MRLSPPRLLIVAGSDSGGGAGIQADIKTAAALGAYAMTAVTAVTVQDTTRVHAVHSVPPDIVRDQIRVCLADIGADVVKTGMLGSAAAVRIVAETLADCAPAIPLVVDPVMAATHGAALLDDDAVAVLIAKLLPRATLLTPNIPEAERLTGLTITRIEEAQTAAEALRAQGARAVLVKGGHLSGDQAIDLLVTANGARRFSSPRIATRATHGTGCTLATAIAVGLAQGARLEDAIARAHAYVHEAIRTAPGLGHGTGPLNHMHPATRH